METLAPGVFRVPEFTSIGECEDILAWVKTETIWRRAEAGRYARNELIHSEVKRDLRDVEVSRDRLPDSLELHLRLPAVEQIARNKYRMPSLKSSRYVLSKYISGCHIRPHSDTTFSTTRRIATCVHYFNEAFSGGELYFPQFRISVAPKTGSILLFYSEYLHGVSEITQGTRYCSVSFLEHQAG